MSRDRCLAESLWSNVSFSLQLASQHPYAEQFIGEPYVYTIDIRNLNDVKETVNTILKNNKVKGQKSKRNYYYYYYYYYYFLNIA